MSLEHRHIYQYCSIYEQPIFIIVAEYDSQYLLVLTLLGKCSVTCSFGIIYIYAAEMFPTGVRSTVLGMCSTCSRVATMLAPFSDQLVRDSIKN